MKDTEAKQETICRSQQGKDWFLEADICIVGSGMAGLYAAMASAELGPYGINVNCIAPGWIATGRLMEQFKKSGEEYYNSCTSLRRLGTPEDCAKVVEFFATDLSDFVTGVTIQVTGGTTNKQ